MKKSKYLTLFSILIISCVMASQSSCTKDDNNIGRIDLAKLPYETLTEYNFFEGELANLQPQADVLPYDLNTPLFSDYAAKARFIYIPEGHSAGYNEEEVFDFPVGTVIIKTFYYDNDFRDPSVGRKILETRLLVRDRSEWLPFSYLWNEEQTAANFSVVGRQVPISWIHFDGSERSTNYLIPNKNQCKGCHSIDQKIVPIGPKAHHLNKLFDYADGSKNQLEKWTEMGYLSGAPMASVAPKLPNAFDPNAGTLEERARAYLDINCGHCHNPKAPANNTGLHLNAQATDPFELGICKAPIAAGRGTGGFNFGILPGNPDESIMPFRMNSTKPDVAMPELARSVAHEEGVALIREWIAAMEPDDCQ